MTDNLCHLHILLSTTKQPYCQPAKNDYAVMKPVCRQMKWSHFLLYARVRKLRNSYHGSLTCCLCSEIMNAIEAEIISLENSIWKRNGWYYYTLATISKGKLYYELITKSMLHSLEYWLPLYTVPTLFTLIPIYVFS